MKLLRLLMWCSVLVLLAGLAMRWIGIDYAGWVIGGNLAAFVFLFLVPAMGERSRQPADAPERRIHWDD